MLPAILKCGWWVGCMIKDQGTRVGGVSLV